MSQDEECMSGTRDEATKLLELYYKHFDLVKATTVERLFVLWEPFLLREFTVLVRVIALVTANGSPLT